MSLTLSPWSSSSPTYTPPSICKGRVERIDDPQGRNRIAVRLFGLQDDQGNIPKDKLEWVHCLSQDSQMPGATSTHDYYPGAELWIMDIGTELIVLGSTAGFDGEKRLSQNPWGVDTSDNTNADVPNINRKQPSDTTVRKSDSAALVGPPGGSAGANDYFQYNNWSSGIVQKMFQYSTGKGAVPAPWGKGDVSKLDSLQSIALQKNVQGSDILNLIIGLDNNQSGSILNAIHTIINLRNNGFGNALNMIGSSMLNANMNQYATQYSSITQNDLVNFLQHLIIHIQEVQQLTDATFYNEVAGIADTLIVNIIALLSNTVFGVSTDTLNAMQSINDNVVLSGGNAPISYYDGMMQQFISLFNSAVSQAYTSVVNQLNQIMANVNNDIATFVLMFGGTQTFVAFALQLLQVAVYLGIPQISVNVIANGVVGLALGGGLLQIVPAFQSQPTNPSNSNQNTAANLLIGLLAMFKGNPIATAELLSGGLIKTFLSNNPIKYKQADRNDGQSVLKKFAD